MIDIKLYHVTEIATNCCYLVDEATGKSAVTDPGAESNALISQIEKDGGRLEYVILTHGHYDHICFAKQLADKFGAKIVTGKHNNEFLGETEIKYLYTPGHTSGCGVYLFDDVMISGDTLFCESYGRTDLPTGDDMNMIASLKKLKELDGDYHVIPGHGPMTTLEHERRWNPLMRRL